MELKLFAIKDTKVEFEPPFPLQTTAELVRIATALVNETRENKFNQYPEDKELWEVGTFDTKTGTITGNDQVHVCNLIDLKTKVTKEDKNVTKDK